MIDLSGPAWVAHPALTRSGLVAGIGLRAQAGGDELLALLDACLAAAASSRADIVALVTIHARAQHPALLAVAGLLGVPVLTLPAQGLAPDVPNPSPRVADLASVPSVAEAAALAFGPLLIEKRRSANLTCALSRYVPAGRSKASSAAATLATSSAGP